MLCQHCHKRVASVHFTHIINNNKVEMYLCDHCAKEKGTYGIGSPYSLNDFLAGLLGVSPSGAIVTPGQNLLTCDKCGMNYDEFQKTGKLGCNHCYKIFGDKLKPLVKRLHGNTEHSGKMPGNVSKTVAASKEIANLKEQLNKAIQSEEYEKAAELRDRIKSLDASQG